MPFTLSQYTVQKGILEIRYAPAFLLWDRSGAIWHPIQHAYPGLKVRSADPTQMALEFPNHVEAYVSMERAHVTTYFPGSDLKSLKDITKLLFSAVLEKLEIANLSRIGLRIILEKSFKDRDTAAQTILENVRTPTLKGKYFNVDGKPLEPELFIRWEGDKLGCSVRVQAIQHAINIQAPMEFGELTPIQNEQIKVIFDVDYYAHASTATTKFDPATLINDWFHTIRRDLPGFLNG
jgi:hypothetical protein